MSSVSEFSSDRCVFKGDTRGVINAITPNPESEISQIQPEVEFLFKSGIILRKNISA